MFEKIVIRRVAPKKKVQGLDYVYTLQGWIKSVNSNTLDPNHDPGKDGEGMSNNRWVARDVMGFSLHYYNGDYASISGNNSFVAAQTGSDLVANSNDLYNGNIGRMVTSITHPDTREVLPLGNAYRYDQLNRLAEARSFTNLSSSNTWGSGQAALYYNAFTYDANGNIATQERWNASNQQIDKLTYNYKKDGNGKVLRNRLYGVTDLVNSGDFTDDIDNMVFTAGSNIETANNYSYDQEGRLIKDIQEEIESIEWRVDGKVKKINRPAGSQKKNVSFDYDAMGHRIAKHVMNAQNQLEISTYYLLDASGNTMAVYEREVDAANASVTFTQEEKYIYGSARLGALNDSIPLLGTQNDSYSQTSWIHTIGQRTYELANHLGNVLSVISDKVIPHANGTSVDYFLADIRHAQDYSAFGVTLYGRNFSASGADGYRLGFNGMEADDELKGDGNSYDFGARMLDPRLGRFLTVDFYAKKICWQSPYIFADNSPVFQLDLNGNVGAPAVEIKGNQVVIGGKKWLEKAKYDYAINNKAGGGKWIYDMAKSEMGASSFGAALILAFAMEEGGWGKGNNQSVTHNPFSLLQPNDNGQKGTAHGYPIIYSSYAQGFSEFHELLKTKYPTFLPLLKKDKVTADDINKALKSGPFHETGGYTDSDKGKAIVGVLKYSITFTVDRLNREIENAQKMVANYDKELKSGKFEGIAGMLKKEWIIIKKAIVEGMIEDRQKEVKELNKAYDNLKEKF